MRTAFRILAILAALFSALRSTVTLCFARIAGRDVVKLRNGWRLCFVQGSNGTRTRVKLKLRNGAEIQKRALQVARFETPNPVWRIAASLAALALAAHFAPDLFGNGAALALAAGGGKRIRRCFRNHSEVSHIWASGKQDSGYAGNMKFDDGKLYSYWTPIARIVQGIDGARVALFSSRSYSSATSQHFGRGRDAWRGNGEAFTVPNLGIRSEGRHDDPFSGARNYSSEYDLSPAVHAANVEYFVAQYREAFDKASRATSYLEHYLTRALEAFEEGCRYAQAFGVAEPSKEDYETAHTELCVKLQEREERRNSPANARKRAKAEEYRANKTRRVWDKVLDEAPEVYFALVQEVGEYSRSNRARAWREKDWTRRIERIEEEKQRAEALRVWNESGRDGAIAAWYRGEIATYALRGTGIGYGYNSPHSAEYTDSANHRGARLRMKGNEIETSQGAFVPVTHARKLYRFLCAIRQSGEGWTANGHTFAIGHFQVSRIEPNGDFQAGCHFVEFAEVERFATRHGWNVEDSANDSREDKRSGPCTVCGNENAVCGRCDAHAVSNDSSGVNS